MAPVPLQTRAFRAVGSAFDAIERWLEAERDQLPVWIPVCLGIGIAAWFVLPDAARWAGFAAATVGIALGGLTLRRGTRAGRVLAVAGLLAAIGTGLIWVRAEHIGSPVLARAGLATFTATIDRIEAQPAREIVRLYLRTDAGSGLPARIRINLRDADRPPGLAPRGRISMRAWLLPPAPAGLPGGYAFDRVAWFERIGATGRALAPVTMQTGGKAAPAGGWRERLAAHIHDRIGGGAGGIAATLATGDRGAIPDADAEAMRRSGLAHLLAISGLHVTAVVGATMLVVLRLLALWPALALRVRLPLVAAMAGATAAIGYTLLTGAAVPTVRSCIAAMLVLIAIAIGREAITLRLIATGALFVLLLWPETLAGPSFQLSFAAVTAIVALHELPQTRRWFERREETGWRRMLRGVASLLLTGLVIEIALAPIALFHFHKSGVYGALANIVAIPLTTFVVMPVEAMALLFDTVGLGAPFWWVTGRALDLLLAIAHMTADAPGAVAALPSMPVGAFGTMIAGGLWIALWRTRARMLGFVPLAAGALWAIATPAPDLLVTGDGRHLAIRTADGGLALLRERAGDYTRSMLGETAGFDGELSDLSQSGNAVCSRDLCLADVERSGRNWRVLATRSDYLVPYPELVAACAQADVAVSERTLPDGCRPRWLKLDRKALASSGGVAISFATGRVISVRTPGDRHPWLSGVAPTINLPRRTPPGGGRRGRP